jgi:chitin disaccharide deacetylase
MRAEICLCGQYSGVGPVSSSDSLAATINSVPRLIINADDLGLTSGVNRAIENACRSGAVTSATLMANSRAFNEAAAMARNLPQLNIGCHIVLVDGEPVTHGLKSLTDGTSKFISSIKSFAVAAIRKQLSQEEIQREAEAQICRIQSAGINLTHVDTHKHTHIFPHVLKPVLLAAKACGIRAIRNPFEPARAWPKTLVAGRPGLWTRAMEVAMLGKFSGYFRKTVEAESISTTDGAVGVIVTGSLDQTALTKTIEALPEGTWELVCHPGYMDADLQGAGTRLLNSRQVELEALESEQTMQVIKKRGIELISYADLKYQPLAIGS